MIAAIIGISLGIVVIFLISILKSLDKKLMYALILSGIGFLYVGFTWTDKLSLSVTTIQAVFFFIPCLLWNENKFIGAGRGLFFAWFLGPCI